MSKRKKREPENCPKCDIELHFIEDLKQHYCYECEDYFDAKGKPIGSIPEPEEAPVAEPSEPERVEKAICPSCGEPAAKVDNSDKFFCYSCEAYISRIEAELAEEAPPLPLEDEVEPESEIEATSSVEDEQANEAKASPVEKELMPEVDRAEPEEHTLAEESKVRKVKAKICESCNSELTFVKKYDRWYCHKCKKYASRKTIAKEDRSCPTCGGDAKFIERYNRWYCWSCKKYLPTDKSKADEAVSIKKDSASEAPKCKLCGKPTTWIAKYERYYCFPCQKYASKSASARPEVEGSSKSDNSKCSNCGDPATWIAKYERYYCYPCKKYMPKKSSQPM